MPRTSANSGRRRIGGRAACRVRFVPPRQALLDVGRRVFARAGILPGAQAGVAHRRRISQTLRLLGIFGSAPRRLTFLGHAASCPITPDVEPVGRTAPRSAVNRDGPTAVLGCVVVASRGIRKSRWPRPGLVGCIRTLGAVARAGDGVFRPAEIALGRCDQDGLRVIDRNLRAAGRRIAERWVLDRGRRGRGLGNRRRGDIGAGDVCLAVCHAPTCPATALTNHLRRLISGAGRPWKLDQCSGACQTASMLFPSGSSTNAPW